MRRLALAVLSIFIISLLTGCEMSKPYVMTTERVDQKMEIGNRGYLKGTPPPPKYRGDLKRPFIAVDINLPEVGESEGPAVEAKEAAAKKVTPPASEKAPLKEEEVK